MNEAKKQELINFLNTDEKRAKELMELSPNDAVVELKKYDLDFSVDEINEFVVFIKEYASKYENGELDESDLENVAGGGLGITFIAGFVVGLAISGGW